MQEFRRFVRGPMGKVLLIAIIVPFVISGFYGYFTATGSSDEVAEVEGNTITRSYVNARVEQIRSMVRQQSPDLDPAMLDAFVRPEMVLEGIINEQLIIAAASKAKMAYSDEQLAREIYRSPQFMENGRFSELVFERETRRRGMTPQSYVRGLRDDLITRQYQDGFVLSDFALPRELEEQRRLGEQQRDIRYVSLSLEQMLGQVSVSDDEVAEYYADNREAFMRPEQFKLAYLELHSGDYADQVTVTDEELQQEYQARRAMAEQAQAASMTQRVAHILIEVGTDRDADAARARAEEALAELRAGADFAELAARYSDDTGSAAQGGDLGVVSRGALPEEMEQAMAALDSGEVSEPVRTDAGFHLIRVESEAGGAFEWPSFAEKEAELRDNLIQAKAEAKLFEDAALLEELVYEHNDLDGPAERLGSRVRQSDWLALDQAPQPFSHPRVREALRSEDVRQHGHNSELIELAANHYIAVRIADHKEAELRPLEEVSAAVAERLKAEKAAARMAELAAEGREKAAAGADLDELAALFGSQVQNAADLQRGARQPDAELVSRAFAMPRAAVESGELAFAEKVDGSRVVFQLTRVEDGRIDGLSDSAQQAALEELGRIRGESSFRQIVGYLREEGSVKVRSDRLTSNR